jgi:hypothetical protein
MRATMHERFSEEKKMGMSWAYGVLLLWSGCFRGVTPAERNAWEYRILAFVA